jgi:hypothetical protein
MINSKKYFFVFLLTCGIFIVAFALASFINNQKIADIKNTEDQISIDILSSETQFEILQQSSCSIVTGSILSGQLATLADQLSAAEAAHGIDSADVITLKEYYSLLEIKDYILMQQIYKQCNARPLSILYFYSNKGNCTDCTKEGYVLTALRNEYPDLRVYSFDVDLGLNAIQTLVSLYHIEPQLPVIVVNDTTYPSFQSIDDIKKIIPDLSIAAGTSTTATSTTATSTTANVPATSTATSSKK